MQNLLVDKFIYERLPLDESQAEYLFDLEALEFGSTLNCVDSLIQRNLDRGRGDNTAIRGGGVSWTYNELNVKVNQIASVLSEQYQLVPGNRVLIRGYNSPMLAAIWLAVLKAGLIAVTTMPLLRARDLKAPIAKAKIEFAICQSSLIDELNLREESSSLTDVLVFDTVGQSASLNAALESASKEFSSYESQPTDVALIAFTSGTTGQPKGCVHYHRDVLSMAICFSESILRPTSEDVFIGSPPLAFTFGLGALLIFPLYAGACAVLLDNASGMNFAQGISDYKATISFTSPTGYSALLDSYEDIDVSSLRLSVAAGEHLNAAIYKRWKELMLAATDWTAYGIDEQLVHSVIGISGIYNLEPIRLCYVNKDLRMGSDDVAKYSPVNHLPPVTCPVALFYGEHETNEFKRQSSLFSALLQQEGNKYECTEIPTKNHFDILFDISNPKTILSQLYLTK